MTLLKVRVSLFGACGANHSVKQELEIAFNPEISGAIRCVEDLIAGICRQGWALPQMYVSEIASRVNRMYESRMIKSGKYSTVFKDTFNWGDIHIQVKGE